jgi:hypothetical protein
MIMKNELGGGPVQARITDQNQAVHTGLFDTPHKALGEGKRARFPDSWRVAGKPRFWRLEVSEPRRRFSF